MEEIIKKCTMCPHECKVNRYESLGRCKANENVKVALVSTHDFEEPPISGSHGSGTIFFSGCNLGCIYCQNYEISQGMFGKEISIKRLADIMLEQQQRGVHNINLVTPTIYAYQIKEAIKLARKKGLALPIVYNTSGYESIDTLKELEGYIDIYLPDFKYFDNELSKKYSNVKDYASKVKEALVEMRRQVEDNFDSEGIMQSGLIVRHMILPNHVENTKQIIKWIKDNLGENTIISVMAQYFPTHKANEHDEINRKISKEELDEVENYLFELNMINGYIQELGEHEEEYVPEFNLDNV
ncbi:MAG: radical SAM protein [Clostridia bacterium]|nr:radical SAM protein [Clostridia bacterium]